MSITYDEIRISEENNSSLDNTVNAIIMQLYLKSQV